MSSAADSVRLSRVLMRTAEVFERRAGVAEEHAQSWEELGRGDKAAERRRVVRRAREAVLRARSEAARLERRRLELDERERRADERDRVADERERAADERERIADQRERAADERETRLYERLIREGAEPGSARVSASPAVDPRRLFEVFMRTAEVFERSAALAEEHARRCEERGRGDLAAEERGVAERVRVAARRARSEAARLEQRRLEKLLSEWLEIEKSRGAFTVRATEQKQLVSLGGLEVKTRADRVDRLADGREIILDYKTGQVKSRGWQGDRPDEPQLPLYCATSEGTIAGAAFALIRTGDLGFLGYTDAGAELPAMKKMEVDAPASFGEQVGAWRMVLEGLAVNFREGQADVDPKKGACEQCGLRALCRIREIEDARG